MQLTKDTVQATNSMWWESILQGIRPAIYAIKGNTDAM